MFWFTTRNNKVEYEFFGLIDSYTGRLLILDKNFERINILRGITENTIMITIPTRTFFEKCTYHLLRPGTFHLMTWRVVSLSLEINLKDRDAFRERSLLITAKYRTLCLIIEAISNLRLKMDKGIFLQETVYLEKAFEAQRFRDRGYPEHEILEYPFVLKYADCANISVREAADRILLKANIRYELLARSESLRITYFNQVKDAKSHTELGKIYRNFLLDYDIKL